MAPLTACLVIILQCVASIYSQVPSPYGNSFAVAFPPIRETSSDVGECKLYINSATDQTVTITSNDKTSEISVSADATSIYTFINCEARVAADGLELKAVYVDSPNPISVMIVSSDTNTESPGDNIYSMDTALMYPIDFAGAGGAEFYTYTYSKAMDDGTRSACGPDTNTADFVIIIASEDGTTIQMRDPPNYGPEVTYIDMNRFDTYYFHSTVGDQTNPPKIISRKHITTNKPIAVIAGSLCADATFSENEAEGVAFGAMPPVSAYTVGEYISYQFYTATTGDVEQADYYDIVVLASQDNTNVDIGGGNNTLNRGEVRQYQLLDTAEKIVCYNKCMVMQFSKNNADQTGICMLQVQPTASYGTYSAYTNYEIPNELIFFRRYYYILILTENVQDYNAIQLSDQVQQILPWTCVDFSGNRGRYCSYLGRIENEESFSKITTTNQDATFTAVVYWSSTREAGSGYCFNTGVTYV